MSAVCEQCGSTGPLNRDDEYGPLCDLCAFRQAEKDNSSPLSAGSFGFRWEDE